MHENDTNFPIDVRSPFVNFLQQCILWGIKILAFLMTLVILWGIVDVFFNLYEKATSPPFLLINIENLLSTFGSFLVVLIAIEIFLNIILYLRKDMGHIKLVVATALMAIARKVIILDYDHTSAAHMVAIGFIILALGIAYWLICRSNSSRTSLIHPISSNTPANQDKF